MWAMAGDQAVRARTVFGTGVVAFANGLVWLSSPDGVFTLRPLGAGQEFFRAGIVIGPMVAAYGLLAWRRVSHSLTPANYIVVGVCAAFLILGLSRLTQWAYTLEQGSFSLVNILKVAVADIVVTMC